MYQRMAARLDRLEWIVEVLGIRRLRRRFFSKARGSILEVAIGTGRNLPWYPADCEITGVDLSPAMLAQARKLAAKLGREACLREMNAERLEFSDDTFDTVTSSLGLCTFPDPVRAVAEMQRVCHSGGRVLLLEHGRSDREWLGRWQDRRAERHARQLGCIWNREPLEIVAEAGLPVESSRRVFLGVFHFIEGVKAAR